MDETVLRRPAPPPGQQVMRDQIDEPDRGRPAARTSPSRCCPFAAGLHPAMYGPFRIFRFDAPRAARTSSTARAMTSAFYIDKPDETALYTQALDRISAQAAPPERPPRILRDIRKEI